VFVERRSDYHSYDNAKEPNNLSYFSPSSTSSFFVESTVNYYSRKEVDVSQQVEKDKNYSRDYTEWERRIEEKRRKGDYEGHIRETPRNLGDLPVYYKLAGCLDGNHAPQCDYHNGTY